MKKLLFGCIFLMSVFSVLGKYSDYTYSLSPELFFDGYAEKSDDGEVNLVYPEYIPLFPNTSTSSNAGFDMSTPAGCTPVTVGFTNNNLGLLSYFWDFGNGNISVLENPDSVTYHNAGTYIVQYSAVQTDPTYSLQSIEVVSGDCTDGLLTGDIDLFYTVSTTSGVLESVSSGNYITQPFPLIINNFNPLLLIGQSVSISVYDNDDVLFLPVTENCGSFSFAPLQQPGTHSANGGGLALNYTVTEIPGTTVIATDTIYVYDSPAVPVLVYDPLNNLIYTDGGSVSMQWYYNDSPLPGATDTFINPTSSGEYSLVVVNGYGCATSSDYLPVIRPVTLESIPFSGTVKVGPNPVSNGFPLTIYIENAEFSEATIVLMDLYGREVIRRVVNPSLFPYRVTSKEISKLSNGLYYLDISFDENKIRKKIVKTGTN